MRNVEDRLRWYVTHRPDGGNRCAEYLMQSLDVPRQGLPDASAVAHIVKARGQMQGGPCPVGAIHYWDRGSGGHGHVAYEYNVHGDIASVDVAGAGTVGIRPLSWFTKNWPALRYLGWSWYWGNIDTQPKEAPVAEWPAIGSSKVIEPTDKTLKDGVYGEVGRITLPKGKYLLTLQGRLPAGSWARVEFQRVGWGDDPDGRDQTGSTPWLPAPDGKATSYTHNHEISGGGPVAFMVKPYGPGDTTTVVSLVVKALRLF